MKPYLYKMVCGGIAVLFVAMAAVPAIGVLHAPVATGASSDITDGAVEHWELVTLSVTEHHPDGTLTSRAVQLAPEDVEALHRALDDARGLSEQLDVLKQYGVIPLDASSEEMLAAVRGDLTGVEPASIWLPPLSVVWFSEVSASFRWGVSLRVGMTPFLDMLDRLLGIDWQRGVDLADLCVGMRGTVYTYGPLGTHRLYLKPGMVFMTGFVGYTIDTVLWRHSFYGAAVMTVTAGLGEHDFDPWFP